MDFISAVISYIMEYADRIVLTILPFAVLLLSFENQKQKREIKELFRLLREVEKSTIMGD